MTGYPVALAAEDFVPVALTALGMAMPRHLTRTTRTPTEQTEERAAA